MKWSDQMLNFFNEDQVHNLSWLNENIFSWKPPANATLVFTKA